MGSRPSKPTLNWPLFTQNQPPPPLHPRPCFHNPKSRNRSCQSVLSPIYSANLTSADPRSDVKKPLRVKPCHHQRPTQPAPASSPRPHSPCMCAHYIPTHLIYIHSHHQPLSYILRPPTPLFTSVPVNYPLTHFHHSPPCHTSHTCQIPKAAKDQLTTSSHTSSMPVSALTTHVQQ